VETEDRRVDERLKKRSHRFQLPGIGFRPEHGHTDTHRGHQQSTKEIQQSRSRRVEHGQRDQRQDRGY
jgi:hypothetical protein